MTDRVKALTVLLDSAYRDDDVQHLVNAISMMRGVAKVEPILVDGSEIVTIMQCESEARAQLSRFIEEFSLRCVAAG